MLFRECSLADAFWQRMRETLNLFDREFSFPMLLLSIIDLHGLPPSLFWKMLDSAEKSGSLSGDIWCPINLSKIEDEFFHFALAG